MERIYRILQEIEETQGTNAKVDTLMKYKDDEELKKVLHYCYESSYNFGISKKNLDTILKTYECTEIIDRGIFEVLNILKKNNINNELRQMVVNFMSSNTYYTNEVFKRVINGNIEIGLAEKGIEKVFPNFVSKFQVQLAEKFDEKYVKGQTMYITEKLDGIRAVYCEGQMRSRTGKVITGLDHIIKDIQKTFEGFYDDVVLDGELIYKNVDNCTSDINFRRTTKIVNSNQEQKLEIEYKVFDILKLSDFKKGESLTTYETRRSILNKFEQKFIENKSEHIKVVPVVCRITEVESLMHMLSVFENKGCEGLMVNFDTTYKCKRHRGIMKVKTMNTVDLEVLSVEEGQGENQGILGNILVKYKGNIVGVGSGFTKYEREVYWNNPRLIVGKIAEIQYFEESKNQNGGISLRFPVFKMVREDKTEESYH